MKLEDMTATPAPAESIYGGAAMPGNSPYPYGLRINLTQDQLGKFGYKDPPPAGTTLHIEATGVVIRSSTEDPDADGDIDFLCVEVQITQMGMEESAATAGSDSDDDAGSAGKANRLYGKEKAA